MQQTIGLDNRMVDQINRQVEEWQERVDINHQMWSDSWRKANGLEVTVLPQAISVSAIPRFISRSQYDTLQADTAFINNIVLRAAAFGLAQPEYRQRLMQSLGKVETTLLQKVIEECKGDEHMINQYFKSHPFYARVDNLIGDEGLIPIEINTDCPEGLGYLTTALDMYHEMYGLLPEVHPLQYVQDMMTELGKACQNSEPNLAFITRKNDPVSTVEGMRLVAYTQNSLARRGINLQYGHAEDLELGSDNYLYLDSTRLDGIWRNWELHLDEGDDRTLEVLTNNTKVMDPAHNWYLGLKSQFGIAQTEDFMRTCTPDERARIREVLPRTVILSTTDEVEQFADNEEVEDYIFKKAYSTSGKGVTRCIDEAYHKVQNGELYVAQQLVKPLEPNVDALVIADGTLDCVKHFQDLNPYLLQKADGTVVPGPIVNRHKQIHPINVAQGGCMSATYVQED